MMEPKAGLAFHGAGAMKASRHLKAWPALVRTSKPCTRRGVWARAVVASSATRRRIVKMLSVLE